MRRYWKVFLRIIKMSLARQFLYKENTWLGLLGSFAYFFFQVVFIKYLFMAGNVEYVGGYNIYEFYLMLGFGQVIITFIFWFVIDSSYKATFQIYKGGIDYFLIKPMDPRFLIMHQEVSAIQSISIFIYLTFLFYYLFTRHDFGFGISDWMLIVGLLLVSVLVHALIQWFGVLLNFYWPNFWGIWMFMSNISDINRYPKNVYPQAMQFILTFIIPVFLINNPIYQVLDSTFTWEWGMQIFLMLVIMVTIFLLLWKDGLKRYSSAA